MAQVSGQSCGQALKTLCSAMFASMSDPHLITSLVIAPPGWQVLDDGSLSSSLRATGSLVEHVTIYVVIHYPVRSQSEFVQYARCG
jgi:hypothetical protein